jgi:hypothetical protein
MFRLNARTLRANVDVFSLENVRSPALMWISEPGVAPLSRAYPRLMNAVPSGLSRRFATKLNGHSFSTPSRPKEEPKNCQEPFPLFCDVFPVYLSIKTRKIQHETVHAVAVQPRWGRRGEWVQDYPGCAARSRPCAVEFNVVGVSPRYATHHWISHIARSKPQRGFTILTVASPAKRRGQAIRSLALFQSTRSPSIA